MTCKMRKKGYGTFDERGKGSWSCKCEGIRATVPQLSTWCGRSLIGKTDSEPVWRKYVDEVRYMRERETAATSPLPNRTQSLMDAIKICREHGIDVKPYEAELKAIEGIQEWHCDVQDMCVLDPRWAVKADEYGIDHRDHAIGKIMEDFPIPDETVKANTVKAKVKAYLASATIHKDAIGEHRIALEAFIDVVGNKTLAEVDLSDWQALKMALWNGTPEKQRTAHNRQSYVRQFLNAHSGNGLYFNHFFAKKYKIPRGKGQKVKYDLAQIRVALQEAKGDERTMLLLGLNCGFINGDIVELKPEHFDGRRINKARQKLHKDETAMIGSWLLWPETIEALKFGMSDSKCKKTYNPFAKKHGLHSQKALRKGITQILGEKFGTDVCRFYQVKWTGGTLFDDYLTMTPPMIAKLDEALTWLRGELFKVEEVKAVA